MPNRELLDRGVWVLPWLTQNGQRVAAAITAEHKWLDLRAWNVGDAAAEQQAIRELHGILATRDPRNLQAVS